MGNVLPRQRRAAKVHNEAVTVVKDIHKGITELMDSKVISSEEKAAISEQIHAVNSLMRQINTTKGCKKIIKLGADFIPTINGLLKYGKDYEREDTENAIEDPKRTVKVDMLDSQKMVDEIVKKTAAAIRKAMDEAEVDEFADCE